MRWYWAVGCDNTVTTPFVGDEGDLGDHESDLTACRQVENWQGNAWVRASRSERDGDPDDVLQTCFFVPIYSARLRAALEDAQITGIQYLPIHVLKMGGIKIPGFSVANILNCVDGLDAERSEVERFPDDYFLPARRGQIRSLNKVVLVGSAVDRYDILRLSGYFKAYRAQPHQSRSARAYVAILIARTGSFTEYQHFHPIVPGLVAPTQTATAT